MATFWINLGKWVLCGGKFAVQGACPCGDCYADVIAAIRERQIVAGRSQWPAVPDPEKTLGECIAEVNAMAPTFYQVYSWPTVALPVAWSSSYATGATDFCDLLDLIKALVTTYKTTTLDDWERGLGEVTAWEQWDILQAAADAAFAYAGGGQFTETSYRHMSGPYAEGMRAQVMVHGWRQHIGSEPAGPTPTVRWFAKHSGQTEWDTWGHTGVPTAANQYEQVAQGHTVYLGEWISPWLGGDPYTLLPQPWPTWPGGSASVTRGYGVCTGRFALIDWGFTYV